MSFLKFDVGARASRVLVAMSFAFVGGTVGCAADVAEAERVGTAEPGVTFEQFERSTFVDADGIYVVDGDIPIVNRKRLLEFYESIYSNGRLIVQRSNGVDAVWSSTQKKNITYCISNSFGSNKSAVVQAMAAATGAWEAAADIKYVYDSSQDGNCTASNANVVFDIRPTSGQAYLARAFFPGQSRSSRNVIIDSSSFNAGGGWTLTGILRHELGHTLGFRHEHTRPEAGKCFEDNSWRALTPYDRQSVMHYPQCNGVNTGLVLTDYDKQGVRDLYGAPGSQPPPPPPPPPPPGGDKTDTQQGRVAQGEEDAFGPYTVTTKFNASITGTGDADLYVRFDAAPTTRLYACRPYESDSTETCDLDVPSGATRAYVMVRGYRAATYTLNVAYR